MLLALDINSRKVGFAFGGPADGFPRVGTWALHGCSDEDTLNRSCATLYNSISDVSKLIHPRIIAVEAPLQMAGRSAHTALGLISLSGVARAAAVNAGAKAVMAHVQTWRKHFVGQGRPDDPKAATIRRCELLGWKVTNDDEADAAGVWCYAMSIHFPKWSPKGTPLFAGGRAAA